MLHSFWFQAAIDAFGEVLTLDPRCAIAEWGIAMAHWGNPLLRKRRKELLRPGAEAVERARVIGAGTERERAYIEAVAELYRDYETTDDRSRALSFELAMQQLVSDYPDDTEAAIFFAMALIGTADPSDKTYAQQLRAAAILERNFEEQPKHPGIAHYLIHAYDVPPLASRALPAAQEYARIAPAAPHALHMPSHTFTRLGYWQESIDTNLRSADSALRAGSPAEALHAIDYMVYAYLQTGQDAAAQEQLARAAEIGPRVDQEGRYAVAGAYAIAAIPARYALERQDWSGAASLTPIEAPAPFIDAIVYFARGLGAARNRDAAAARTELDRLAEARDATGANSYWGQTVEIQRTLVEAWAKLAEGETDRAVETMQSAAEQEDATEKSAVSPGPLAPARELLGEMLLELGRPKEALTAFRATIDKEPGRFRGLYGGAIAAEAAGQPELAREYFEQLLALCEHADPDGRVELARAREYLEENPGTAER